MAPSIPLIRRKLYRPRVTTEFVLRSRLLDQLNTGLARPVTLVAAPAGFGKSTLLARWLDDVPFPAAWLALDENDNDLHLFGSYLIAAIQSIFPGGLQVSTALTQGGLLPDPARLAISLSNDIDELPSEFILVLDDYHAIHDSMVNSMMSSLLRHLPAQIHLVFATRTDAPLPFSRLAAAGQLCELRARDLRFSLAETVEFFQRSVNVRLSEDAVNLLQTRIEGWAVGLRFASMLLQEGADPQVVVEHLVTGRRRSMMGYMLEEVLSKMRPSVRELVLKTALLDQFTAELGHELVTGTGVERTGTIIQELIENDILVALPGDADVWYRYHALFADFLRTHARAAFDTHVIADVHTRASQWYEGKAMITEAIQQAIQAGDIARAAQILYRNLHPALNRESGRTMLEIWLGLFPPDAEDKYLELLAARVCLTGIQYRINALPGLFARADRMLAERPGLESRQRERFEAEVGTYRIAYYQWKTQAQNAIELSSRVLGKLPAEAEFARANVLTETALAEQMVGNPTAAHERLTRELRADISPGLNRRVMLTSWAVYMGDGELQKALDAAETLLRMSKESSPISLSWARYFMGWLHYEWNHLEIAAQHFSAAVELRYQGNAKTGHESIACLVQTQLALGRVESAAATMRELVQFTQDLQSGEFEYHLAAYRAREALILGKVETALPWALSVVLNPRPHMVFEIEPNLTQLRILLATQNPDLIQVMLQDTDGLLEVASALHSKRRVIQLLALQAIARDTLGNRNGALDSLQQSLRLGERGGFMRTYLDLGPRLTRLLNVLAKRGSVNTHVKAILAASPSGGRERSTTEGDTPPPLIEPLTNRELQVLERLALRLTDKEIAQALVISPLTVKAHTDNIYQKLGVNSRQAAVKVGVQVGILSEKVL